MLLTVTLNVAVDRRYVVEGIQLGTVMRVKESSQSAGGKGINVSKVASSLGESVVATGIVGGHTGAYIVDELKKRNIATDFITIEGDSRSSINVYDCINNTHSQFLESGSEVSQQDYDCFVEKYRSLVKKCDAVCISGSIPPGVPDDCYVQMIAIANEQGKPVLFDASGNLLSKGIEAKPTLIKPNEDEISALCGVDSQDFEQIKNAALNLCESGIEYVVVSLGKDGAMLVCEEGIWKGDTPDIPIINTVGCGDSMVAAFAVGILRDMPIEKTFKLSLAVSTANALSEGAGEFLQKDLDYLLKKVAVRKIK